VSPSEPSSETEIGTAPNLLTTVVVLFSLPWDQISREIGLGN
jgi:hypothetical protein